MEFEGRKRVSGSGKSGISNLSPIAHTPRNQFSSIYPYAAALKTLYFSEKFEMLKTFDRGLLNNF